MKTIYLPVLLLLLLAVAQAPGQETDAVTLDNGLRLIQLNGGEPAIASMVLVCPLPAVETRQERAAYALVNELIWLNTSEDNSDGASAYKEIVQAARRFEGTLSSELTQDALIIQISLPKALMPFIAQRFAGMWSNIVVTEELLNLAKRKLVTNHRANTYASVENQLAARLYLHLWDKSAYGFEDHGSDQAVIDVTAADVEAAFTALRNPGNWRLFVRGATPTLENITEFNKSLGAIKSTETSMEKSALAPRLEAGKKVLLEAESNENYAAVAYRLPGADTSHVVMLDLVKEMLRIGARLTELKETLESAGSRSTIIIGSEERLLSSAFYLIGSWSGMEVSVNSAVNLFQGMVTGFISDEYSQEDFVASKKRLVLNYWIRFADIDKYTIWRARLFSWGVEEDTYLQTLDSMQLDDLKSFTETYFAIDNRVSLITVAP